MDVALILFIGGVVLIALIYFWSQLRPESEMIDEVEQVLKEVPLAADGDAVLVSREHGQLVYANTSARQWVGMNGGDPNLEQIANLAQPSDHFFELFAREGQTSFQLGRRWVEASSHRIPTGTEMRTVVIMRELKPGTSNTGVLDLSKAMNIINLIGETVDVSSGIEHTLQSLLGIIRSAMNFDAGEVNLYDPRSQTLTPRGWVGDATYLVSLAEAGGNYGRGESVTGWIAHYREPLLLATEMEVASINPKVSNIPYKSIVGVPLILGERLLGTLEIASMKSGTFTRSDLALLQAISKPVSVAIYNADIYAEQVKRIEDLTNIQQIVESAKSSNGSNGADSSEGQQPASAIVYETLNQRIAELMGTEMAGVFLYNEERGGLVPALPFYGLPDALIRSVFIVLPANSPQRNVWEYEPNWISNNVEDDTMADALSMTNLIQVAGIRNMAWMPLKIGRDRIGMLMVSNKRESGFTSRDTRNLEVLASQAAIVVQNLRLADREQRLNAELAGLQEMTYAIGALDHEDQFYTEITERIARLMGVEMCGILVYDEDNQRLLSRLPFYGVDDDMVKHYSIDISDGTAIQEIWESEDFWYSNRVEADTLVFATGLDQLAEALGVKKTMIAVLSSGGRRLGAVQVSNKTNGGNFDESDGRLLTIFATQAATMIENARLFIEVQKSSEEAQQLRRIAEMAGAIVTSEAGLSDLLGEIAKLMQSPIVYISTFDSAGNLVTNPRWAYGVNLTEPVVYDIYTKGFEYSPAMSKRLFFSNNLRTEKAVLPAYRATMEKYDLRSAIMVPLVVGDRSLGEMGVSNRDGDYTEEDIERINAIAAQITSALERLLLYQATGENLSRRLKELDAVSRISNELNATLDFEQILNSIRKESLQATGATGSTVALLKPNKQWKRPDRPEMERRIGNAKNMLSLADIEHEAVFKGAETVTVRNYADEKLAASPQEARSAAAVAIMYTDQIVGVLHLWHTEPNKFDDQSAAFLLTLATKATLGYGNALRFQEQQDRSERLRRRVDQLNRIFELGQMLHGDLEPRDMLEAVAYSIQQSIGFDSVLVMLADELSGVMRRVTQAGLPLDFVREKENQLIDLDVLDEVLRDEYRTSESYFFPVEKIDDWYIPELDALSLAYEGRRTMNYVGTDAWHEGDLLVVSLMGSGGERLGLMVLDRPYSNERPDRPTIELLEIFTHQAATTLENTQLYQSSLQSAQQEALLNQILEAISSTLNLDQIVQSIGRNMRGQIPFNRVIVALVDSKETGFDVLRLEEDENGELEFTRERRVSLERTALGRTFNERREYRYYASEPDDIAYTNEFEDLRRWRADGETIGIVMPLITGGTCYGAIHIGSNVSNTSDFTRSDQVLRRMTQLFVGGVQNSRLFDQAVELQVLNESVVESIQQGIVVLDQSGRIISLNGFMHRYGWEQSAIGQDIFAYREELADLIGDDLREVLNSGDPRERINQQTSEPDGSSLVRNFYIYPLQTERVVRGAVLLVEDVTERALLEQAMEARANQLAALTEVSSRITSSLERYDVIVLALEEMKWLLHYDTMSLWRRNGSYMVLEGSAGEDAFSPDDEKRIKIADFPDVRLIVDTQRVVAHNYDKPLGEAAVPTGETALSWLGVPLVSQGHVVGMITLNHKQKHAYDSKDDQNIAFAFASQVAIALSNAELFEQTFDRTNELGTVLEAAQATSLTRNLDEVLNIVVELLLGALEMDQCTIMTWDDVDDALEVQIDRSRSTDESRMRPKGMRINLSDYPGKRHSLMQRDVIVMTHQDEEVPYPREMEELRNNKDAARILVPLVVSETSIGLIQLEQHKIDDRAMTQQKVRLATALGSQVAIAIQNARLTSEMESMISESLIINELSQALGSTFNMDDMIATVRNRVPHVTGSEEIYLALYSESTGEITFPMAVRNGEDFEIPPRKLGTDEVSFVIKHNRFLTIGADYFSPEELRKSLGITNGEGDYKSYIGVPLSAENRVHGVLALVDTHRTSAFTMNDRRILEIVATQLGAVIQNARLFKRLQDLANDLERQVEDRTLELEEERDRIDTLYQITSELSRTLDMSRLQQRALGMMVKAIGADDGVILGLDPLLDTLFPQAVLNPVNLFDKDDGTQGHIATSIGEWLIENDNDLMIDDLSTFEHYDHSLPGADVYKSAIAVVLESSQNDPQGVMVLLSRRPAAFGEQEQRLLIAAANQIATATNNADLYNLIRDQAERLTNMLRTEQEEAEKNSAILESIADGVILTDAEGIIIQFNSASERILQLPREQAIGQSLQKFTGIYGTDISAWTATVQKTTEESEDHEQEVLLNEQISLADKIVNVQVSPVYTGGRFLGMVSVFRDITRDVEIDRLKGEFVSNVSHELRTPLTPIKGFTELLLMGAAGPVNDNQTRTLNMIKENVDRLTVLVEDVLDISKIDSGKDKLNVEKVQVRTMLDNVLEKQALRHKNRQVELNVEIQEGITEIEADSSKLSRILSNIIDNAFNYTLDGGSIDVKVHLKPDDASRIVFAIKDTGVGIMEEFRDNIWLRFQRYEEHVLQLDVAGTGLGLSIVKEMVEMHSGDVWFDSEPGKGTTFFVELPVEQSRFNASRSTQTQTMRVISSEE